MRQDGESSDGTPYAKRQSRSNQSKDTLVYTLRAKADLGQSRDGCGQWQYRRGADENTDASGTGVALDLVRFWMVVRTSPGQRADGLTFVNVRVRALVHVLARANGQKSHRAGATNWGQRQVQ